MVLEMRQTVFPDGTVEEPFLYVNGVDLSADATARVAAELANAVARTYQRPSSYD